MSPEREIAAPTARSVRIISQAGVANPARITEGATRPGTTRARVRSSITT